LNGQKFMLMERCTCACIYFYRRRVANHNCETQQEIDHYWERLTESGEESIVWMVER
jgi:predicted 3-demethylubiquinone-9 3-methyltransferase (glyoxalase superfamily)